MKHVSRSLGFSVGVVLLSGAAPVAAFAQIPLVGVPGQQCMSAGRQGMGGDCGRFRARKNHGATETREHPQTGHVEIKYPNATREQPTIATMGRKQRQALDAGLAAADKGDAATAQNDLQPIADTSRDPYAKALAMLGLALIKYRSGDVAAAIVLQKQALDLDSLDNDTYFDGLVSLARMYIANRDYANALNTLDVWSRQSGAQSADVHALQGDAYYRLQKYPEAVAAIRKAKSLSDKLHPDWDRIEAASEAAMGKAATAARLSTVAATKAPANSTALQNAVADDIAAKQYPQAVALLERARAGGHLEDAPEYMLLAKLYVNLGLSGSDATADARKAVAVLQEGLRKRIVPRGLASYKLLGDSYALAGDDQHAVDAYAKASHDARTGVVDFKRGVLLENLGQHRQAKQALEQAIARGGFNRIGSAYLALGNVDVALNQRSAANAAYQQAEKDPATGTEARRALKQLRQQ